MTEQESMELNEWMLENYKDHLIQSAQEIKAWCGNHKCEQCIFRNPGDYPVCLLSPGEYNPTTWRI